MFHKRQRAQSVCMCCRKSSPADSRVTLVFHTAQPQDSVTGQGCRGSSPLWATDLYERRMFVSAHVWLSVCVDGAWRRSIFMACGLTRSIIKHEKQKVTHAHWCWCLHVQHVCEHAVKKQHKTNINCQLLTMSLCCCLHAHSGQPDNQLYSDSLQACRTHFSSLRSGPHRCLYSILSGLFSLQIGEFRSTKNHRFILRSTLKSSPDNDTDHCCHLVVCTAFNEHPPPSADKSYTDSHTLWKHHEHTKQNSVVRHAVSQHSALLSHTWK